MYPVLLSRLIVTLMLCSVFLQGCHSSLQVTPGRAVLKHENSLRTGGCEQANNQVLVSDVQTSASPDVQDSGPMTAVPAAPPSVAATTVQLASASPIHHFAVKPDAAPSRRQALSTETELEETDAKPAARPIAQVVELPLASCLTLPSALPFPVPVPVFGAKEWRRYFGEVGEEPSLPSDIDEILGNPCPFWPDRAVRDTHLLVLIPSTVDGRAFNLNFLGDLIQTPRVGGRVTQYFLYDDEVQRSLGDVYSSSPYWVLLTRDVLPGSRSKPYAAQRALVAAQAAYIDCLPYEIPHVLEAATAILSHHVRSGNRLYEGGEDELPSTSTRCTELLGGAAGNQSPVTVGHFCSRGLVFLNGFDDDTEFGISCLRKFGTRNYRSSALLHSFGAEEWSRYFGEVEAAPPLPEHIVDTLNSPCPFWTRKAVKDTHLLVLIPSTVAGKPFSLNLLGELIERPKGGGHSTKYRCYSTAVQAVLGAHSPERSYWVLLTRDVLEGSRRRNHAAQQALVAARAVAVGLPYTLPSVLEAATAILSYYVLSGEYLYVDAPLTYTRCQELVNDKHPVIVGGFSSEGLDVRDCYDSNYNFSGVGGLRKF